MTSDLESRLAGLRAASRPDEALEEFADGKWSPSAQGHILSAISKLERQREPARIDAGRSWVSRGTESLAKAYEAGRSGKVGTDGGVPLSDRDAHHAAILRALDTSIQRAARARGVAACDGLDSDEPCDVGDLHTHAGQLAQALAAMIDEPGDANLGMLEATMAPFALALVKAFAGKPRLS